MPGGEAGAPHDTHLLSENVDLWCSNPLSKILKAAS